jgi:catechol 2,3-dioxygenase-like lactoylglutathione lyase family enzyme
MEFHYGRLLDHLHLRVSDLAKSKAFYRAVLRALDRDITFEGPHAFAADELWITDEGPATGRVHFAFQAEDRDAVARFHAAALAAGGGDNGAPGERPYHPGYYSAYVLDPDGNNVEAVFHGAARRSAESVRVTPVGGPPPDKT